jgi:DNA-binding NarL/FixJ family response regulator
MQLSPQQTVIMALVSMGKQNKEIGAGLSLSTNTVRTQLHRTYIKLGASGRMEAVKIIEKGYCN